MSELTSHRKHWYINKNPNSCPFCDKSDGYITHVGEPFHAGGVSIWQEVTCKECRSEWYDVYQLVDIEMRTHEPTQEGV